MDNEIYRLLNFPHRIHILQADREEIFNAWVQALQSAISFAIHKEKDDNQSPPSSLSGAGVKEQPKMPSEKAR